MSTHLEQRGNPIFACGVDRRTAGFATFTEHKLAVTCEACKATPAFAQAVQRIPLIPSPVYHG